MKNATNRILIVFCVTLIIILAGIAVSWFVLNYYFIPKVVIPEIKNKIAAFNRDNKVDLKIGKITYHPLKGFQLEGIEFRPILTAKEVDIDLDYLALLSRRIRLPQINIIEADLVITRSGKGEWNYSPALKSLFKKGKTDQPLFFDIDQINVSRSRVDFDDRMVKHNRLTKHFVDVEIKIKSSDREDFFVEASGADAKGRDAIRFAFHYLAKTGQLKGSAELKLANLADYSEYYLDEFVSPWRIGKAWVDARAEFAFGPGERQLKLNAGVEAEGLSLLFGEMMVLEKGRGEIVVTENGAWIKKIRGDSRVGKVDLEGKFVFLPKRRLDLSGKIGAFGNDFYLKFLSGNSAQIGWVCSAETSRLNIHADLLDIKNLIFSGTVSGQVDLERMSPALEESEYGLKGEVLFSGDLRGEFDDPETFAGKLGLKFKDFSILGLEPLSFLLGMKVEEGEFSSAIPTMDLYGGALSGEVILDSERWGIGLDIKKIDLSKFAKVKGIFTAKGAVVGNWGDKKSIVGGGIFDLTNADLKNAAIFAAAQQGLGSVVKDFKLPDFKEVKGNFGITNEVVSFGNATASAPGLELKGSGTIDFQNKANFTMGVKFIRQHGVKTALYVFFPLQTLGVDLLANTIKIEINGTIPNLKQTTTVQPLSWLTDAFNDLASKFDPSRYTLDMLY